MEIAISRDYAYFTVICTFLGVIVAVVLSVLCISKRIGMWKLFEKAGEKNGNQLFQYITK